MFRPGNLGHLGRLGLVAASAYAQSVIVSQAYDPHYANVSLLLHGDGADNGTVFTDNSPTPKTVTAYGNAKISTAQSKFGGASCNFPGSSTDYAIIPTSSDFAFGTGDFTIEAWLYIPTGISGSYAAICDIRATPQGNNSTLFKINSSRQLGYYSASEINTTSSVPLATWTHVAICRSSGTTRLFIDGVLGATATDNDDKTSRHCYIGRVYDNAHPAFSGYIDDLRITKGVARYTESFTPPAAAFPNYGQPVYVQPVEVIASASTLLGAASAYAQSVIASLSGATL